MSGRSTGGTPAKRARTEAAPPKSDEPAPASPPAQAAPAPAAPAPPPVPRTAEEKRLEQEAWLTKQESDGDLRFVVIQNDRVEQHSIWLVDLKNIFGKQLPNMPKDYIVRLVFDNNHKSLVAVKDGVVIGGITYRVFHRQHLSEVAFCAVSGSEQVKGYGTRLMNKLKEYTRAADQVTHLITFADNNAVGYFQKQGFSKEILLEREKWSGYIKEYDGGTLMEALLTTPLPPPTSDFPALIRAQRAAVEARIRETTSSHVVHPGLAAFKEAPGQELRPGGIHTPIPLDQIPGLAAAGFSPHPMRFRLLALPGCGPGGAPTRENLSRFMKGVHASVCDHADSWPFEHAVDGAEVTDYYEIVREPIDLAQIQQRIEGDYYITLEQFAADFRRLFNNCRLYNAPDTPYFKCANRLESFYESKMASGISWTKRS